VKLTIVVSGHDRETVTGSDEPSERAEHPLVALGHARQLEASVVFRSAETEGALFGRGLGGDGGASRVERNPEEVDEIAVDDQVPRLTVDLGPAIVLEQRAEIVVDALRASRRRRSGPIADVAPEVHVGQDQQIPRGLRRGPSSQ